ncbi:hypothetical protein KEM60_03295 [Austwickia sp. TVS 96-490-7B]|nr:hypothetical protein [Austwickia sp. TVS 96-490-7B]
MWSTSWFELRFDVPEDRPAGPVELAIDLGWADHSPGFQCEGLIFTAAGEIVKAVNPRNTWVSVADRPGEQVLYLEAAANPLLLEVHPFLPTHRGEKGDPTPIYTLGRIDLVVRDLTVVALADDLEAMLDLADALPEGVRRRRVVRDVERCLDALPLQDISGGAAAARECLDPSLSAPAEASAHRLTAVGHAHIDSAWLWPVRETRRKVARTLSNVLALIDRDADFRFAFSQVQHLAWLETDQPALFDRVCAAIQSGAIEPVGGMWVESDTNMVGGEAFVRQFLHGQRYLQQAAGARATIGWLPDTFGYTPALPQLLRLAGIDAFLTQKISWNQTNKFPHHTFNWEGLDGTRIFTHFPPVDTYGSELSMRELRHAVDNFRDKDVADHSLVPFGYGDGGGGPTRDMLDRAHRTADLEGVPKVTLRTAREFFDDAKAEHPDPPVWRGELYLEFHRGTLTTQRHTKRGNRRTEHLLREAELWATTAAVRLGATYPYEVFERIWRQALLDQFHDTLPGTSISWVHREVAQAHASAATDLESVIADTLQVLGATGLVNAAPVPVRGIPPMSCGPLPPTAPVTVAGHEGGAVLDNGVVRVVIDDDGCIVSAMDLATGRETLPPGTRGNELHLHEDFPAQWDAWDIDEYYRHSKQDVSSGTVMVRDDGEGPRVQVVRTFGDSTVTQQLSLDPGGRRLDVRTHVDWHEREHLLKVAFPVDVHADEAAFETQFGHMVRPTHVNTSWDAARFEVCAHRWVHVGEPGFGVAVVNDCLYGHEVTRHARTGGGTFSQVRLTLVRSPRFPDPDTDLGGHDYHVGLVIGADRAEAAVHGYAVNLPLRDLSTAPMGVAPDAMAPLVQVVSGTAVVEAVKLAEDRSGDVIVRLYESSGRRGCAQVRCGFAAAEVRAVGILEDDLTDPHDEGLIPVISHEGDLVEMALRPFQIVTLRVRRS